MKQNITWNAASQGRPMLVFWYRRTLPGCICKCDRVTMGSWHVQGEQMLPRIPTTGSPASRTHQMGALLATTGPLPTLMMKGRQEGALKPSGELPQNLLGPLECREVGSTRSVPGKSKSKSCGGSCLSRRAGRERESWREHSLPRMPGGQPVAGGGVAGRHRSGISKGPERTREAQRPPPGEFRVGGQPAAAQS